jgi:Asp-tRNA(Asn)/Glu-tRNA(Gln) amidotransferase A subunit family amidase
MDQTCTMYVLSQCIGGVLARTAATVSLQSWWCRLNRDTVGIISRTVEDAARVLGAVAGHDPSDAQTQLVQTQPQPDDWTYFLDKHG